MALSATKRGPHRQGTPLPGEMVLHSTFCVAGTQSDGKMAPWRWALSSSLLASSRLAPFQTSFYKIQEVLLLGGFGPVVTPLIVLHKGSSLI
ncbi:hypothetical protein F2Q69_00045908 [Brassica cretica]|uniref:Uncharacterized protein n=1 Tax=Brassica cretica TaxID=69181 RepID=A0A8S9PRG7_BRACR|nr:hypothetical protein F2Q69_00045908 [Brassica cretica]